MKSIGLVRLTILTCVLFQSGLMLLTPMSISGRSDFDRFLEPLFLATIPAFLGSLFVGRRIPSRLWRFGLWLVLLICVFGIIKFSMEGSLDPLLLVYPLCFGLPGVWFGLIIVRSRK